MQEGGVAQGTAVGQSRSTLGGIENQLNAAVFDGVHDMWTAFQYLVDVGSLYALFREVTLGSRGRYGLETEGRQQLDRRQDPRLVGILNRDEDSSTTRQAGTAADLAFCESDLERPVDSHHLAGRLHLRSEHGVDAGEAREGEDRFFHRPVLRRGRFQIEVLEFLASHDAGGNLGDGKTDDLRNEGHRTRCARVHFQNINLAVLD